jgi:platelet-activating factor acetylhydrolase IB subunit alpha
LKNKFTQEAKINALKQLEKEGIQGISNYQQSFVLTASRDKSIRLFALHSGEHLFSFIGHDNWVRGLAMHPTGKYLYSASDDKTVRIWDLNFGKEKKKLEAHEHFISSIRFHKKYGIVATGGNDLIIKIWHLK